MDTSYQTTQSNLTTETISVAETLIDITFTPQERELMLKSLIQRVKDYQSIRRVQMANALAPPLYFDPRVSIPAVDNERHYHPSQQEPIERPANLEDVAFFSVSQLAHLIRTQQVTSLELTEMYLERLKHHNHRLECVITFTEDRAIQQAKQADEEIAEGHYRSPLHGIPWGAKDLIAVKGYPTTWGSSVYQKQQFDEDATVVKRLDEAGAVLIAKLATGELAYGDQWFDGSTKNPWNPQEASGGSSAGPASAVGGGLVGFALGTETTGSILWPALRCGAVGYRPTFGLVSRHGVMILSWTLDKVGPIARSVEDCAWILNAIYGPDSHDAYTIDFPLEWAFDIDMSQIRVGYVPKAFEDAPVSQDHDHATVSPLKQMGIDLRENKGNDRRTLDTLRKLGVKLIPIELPDFDLDALLIILGIEGASVFSDLTLNNQDDKLVNQDEMASPNRFRQARFVPAVEYLQANRIRGQLMSAMAALMPEVDVIVSPQLANNNLTLTNLTGQPSIGIVNGFTDEGMPTGINFIGGVGKDAQLLAIAYQVQLATNFHHRHPEMNYDQ